jgi:hypothetical protein
VLLYVELLKALYGTLKAARFFWPLLSGKLQEWGFTINGYDACVANKVVDGKQCTIIWHVDDLKISHIDSKVVDHIIAMLEAEFGREEPLTVRRGKVHDYLGMILGFSTPGKLVVSMEPYIRSTIEEMPEVMTGTAVNPAASHLFDVYSHPEYIREKESTVFVHLVKQLLCPDVR